MTAFPLQKTLAAVIAFGKNNDAYDAGVLAESIGVSLKRESKSLKRQNIPLDKVLVKWKPRFRDSTQPQYPTVSASMADTVFHHVGDIDMLQMTAQIRAFGQEPPEWARKKWALMIAAKKAGYSLKRVKFKSNTGVIFVKDDMVLTVDGAERLESGGAVALVHPDMPEGAGYANMVRRKILVARAFSKWIAAYGDSDNQATITKRLADTGADKIFKVGRFDIDKERVVLDYYPKGSVRWSLRIGAKGDWPDLRAYILRLSKMEFEGKTDDEVSFFDSIDAAAHEAATSPRNYLPEPTDGQKLAGSYKMGRIQISGLDIAIENPEGSVRSGVGADGGRWANTMQLHYGYINGSHGADGDHVDVFVMPGLSEDYDGPVYVIDQIDPETGDFDEHKVIIGAYSLQGAKAMYLSNYDKGWQGCGDVTMMPWEEFREWIKSGDTKGPVGEAIEMGYDSANVGAAAVTGLSQSLAVGRNGKLLKVWHGVKNPDVFIAEGRVIMAPKFKRFHPEGRTEPGIWFSTDKKFAAKYGEPIAFYLNVRSPIQHEGPLKSKPMGHDAVYRIHGKGNGIADALEIAVFDPDQIVLAEPVPKGAKMLGNDPAMFDDIRISGGLSSLLESITDFDGDGKKAISLAAMLGIRPSELSNGRPLDEEIVDFRSADYFHSARMSDYKAKLKEEGRTKSGYLKSNGYLVAPNEDFFELRTNANPYTFRMVDKKTRKPFRFSSEQDAADFAKRLPHGSNVQSPLIDNPDDGPAQNDQLVSDATGGDVDMFGDPIQPPEGMGEDLFGDDTEMPAHLPIDEIPLHEIGLSADVPQFKSGADDETGVVEPLGGKFDRTGVAPIQLWKRRDGRYEVISGRHRLDLARRSGEKTIPSQVHHEDRGFDSRKAAMLDAELNIRDGQGKVRDYVDYFTHSGIDDAAAEAKGLLARHIGQRAFVIAKQGGEDLIAAHKAEIISDQAAADIAGLAPGNAAMQAVGIRAIQEGKPIQTAVNTMRAVMALARESGQVADTMDLFGFDDSALREAENMAKLASRKQRQINEQLASIKGAAKRPEMARKQGVSVEDPEAVRNRVVELTALKHRWDNWSSHSDLLAEIRTEISKPGFDSMADDDYWLGIEEVTGLSLYDAATALPATSAGIQTEDEARAYWAHNFLSGNPHRIECKYGKRKYVFHVRFTRNHAYTDDVENTGQDDLRVFDLPRAQGMDHIWAVIKSPDAVTESDSGRNNRQFDKKIILMSVVYGRVILSPNPSAADMKTGVCTNFDFVSWHAKGKGNWEHAVASARTKPVSPIKKAPQ